MGKTQSTRHDPDNVKIVEMSTVIKDQSKHLVMELKKVVSTFNNHLINEDFSSTV